MFFTYEGNSRLSGIYEIVNRTNGKRYIGSAKEFKARWKHHASALKNNKHQNKHLQRAFCKYFSILETDNFLEFRIIETLPDSTKEERLCREEFWIEFANQENIAIYNKNYHPTKEPTIIHIPSADSRRKMSEAAKNNPKLAATQFKKAHNRKHTEEQKRKIGISNSKKYDLSLNPLIGPCNQRILWINGLSEFCRDNGLGADLFLVLNGKQKSHRGWRLANTIKKASAAKTYKSFGTLLSPAGERFVQIENLSQFCREHGLLKIGDSKNLSSLLSGKIKSCKGWTVLL